MGKVTHGLTGSPTYRSWHNMLNRCNRPCHGSYKSYGAKGVKVAERWLKFANFLEDMGVRPEGTTLGRFEDKGNYEPGNCAWQTKEEQTRRFERNPKGRLTEEQILCAAALVNPGKYNTPNWRQMSRELGLSPDALSYSVHRYFNARN